MTRIDRLIIRWRNEAQDLQDSGEEEKAAMLQKCAEELAEVQQKESEDTSVKSEPTRNEGEVTEDFEPNFNGDVEIGDFEPNFNEEEEMELESRKEEEESRETSW